MLCVGTNLAMYIAPFCKDYARNFYEPTLSSYAKSVEYKFEMSEEKGKNCLSPTAMWLIINQFKILDRAVDVLLNTSIAAFLSVSFLFWSKTRNTAQVMADNTETAGGNNSSLDELQKRNVEYILLAEFDIDQGAILKHQYPRPTGANESYVSH